MKQKRVDGNCMDCAYSMTIYVGCRFYACDYQGIMGISRPCKYGYECNVKKKVRKKVGKSEGEMQVAVISRTG